MAKRIHTCVTCGKDFEPPHSFTRYCSKACFGLSQVKPPESCSIPGCSNLWNDPASRGVGGMCMKHWRRMQRHGDPDATLNPRMEERAQLVTEPRRALARRTYRTVMLPSHPLANKSGKVAVHRMVLFDRIGGGCHPCHWCGVAVSWNAPARTSMGLVADHIDGNRHNNDPANIVAACQRCNVTR